MTACSMCLAASRSQLPERPEIAVPPPGVALALSLEYPSVVGHGFPSAVKRAAALQFDFPQQHGAGGHATLRQALLDRFERKAVDLYRVSQRLRIVLEIPSQRRVRRVQARTVYTSV